VAELGRGRVEQLPHAQAIALSARPQLGQLRTKVFQIWPLKADIYVSRIGDAKY
jgi:hypothetical protein